MDLWIRSQNRGQLSKPNKLYVHYLNEERYEILSGEGFYVLGTYKTKERALEVLDEIQKYIEKQGTNEILVNDNGIPNGSIYYGKVYEMPKE